MRFTNAQNPVSKCVTLDSIWDAIVDGEYWDAGNNFPDARPTRPSKRLSTAAFSSAKQTISYLLKPTRTKESRLSAKPGFVFCSAYYMKMDAQYADVVVPVTTRWENDQAHLYVGTNTKDKENGFASRAPLPRHFESRPDREIAAELAVRLGLDYEALNPASDKQTWFDQISQTEIINFDGSGNSMRVAEVTQEDLDRYDVNGQPQPDSSPSSNTSKTASTASSAQPTING